MRLVGRECWYCLSDPIDELGPCEACDERDALVSVIDILQKALDEAEAKLLKVSNAIR